MTENKSFVFRFEDVEVREREFTVIKAGEVLPVEPKIFRLLVYLLHNPQRLTTKEELLDAVWGDAAVTESSLTRTMALLRRLLGDEIRSPRYIETVATVGYRFLCQVEILESGFQTPAPAGNAATNGRVVGATANPPLCGAEEAGEATKTGTRKDAARRKLRMSLVPGAGLFLLALAALWYLHRPLPPPRITEYTRITHDDHEKYLVGTDGSRLYFEQISPQSVAQVSVAGGESVPIPIAQPIGAFLDDVSNDGSSFLIRSVEKGNPSAVLWNVRVLGGAARRLGNFADAAFSPDGKTIAYTTFEGDIWLIQSDGTGAHKLASLGGLAVYPAWSPDGRAIRFTRSNALWEISSNGSNLHQLLSGWFSPRLECCGRWTPNGDFFLFLSGDTPSGLSQIWALDERRGPFRPSPAQPVELTTGPIDWDRPLPSNDGKKIFAEGVIHRGELSRFDTQTKQFQPFLGGKSVQGVEFSPDGKSVAYVTFPEGNLWKAGRDGDSPIQLTSTPISAGLARWSPDGKQLVFTDTNSPTRAIYVISSDGGSPRRLLPEDKGAEGDPNWSSDGRKIVFASGQPGGWDAKSDLRILDLESHKVSTVPESLGMYSPRWSPDGRFIYATHFDNNSGKILDVETGRWSDLPPIVSMNFPEWSRDSQFIYYLHTGEDRGLFRIRARGGAAEKIADLKDWHLAGWFNTWMGLDPTDSPLLLRDTGSDEIYALTLQEK